MNNPTCHCGHQHPVSIPGRTPEPCRWFKRLYYKDRGYVHTRRQKHGAKEIISRCDCKEAS